MDCQAPGLQDFDYMEIEPDNQNFFNLDPNLNVTSVPEQLDLAAETTIMYDEAPVSLQLDEPGSGVLTELSTVCPQSLEPMASETDRILEEIIKECNTPGVSLMMCANGMFVPDFPCTEISMQGQKQNVPTTVTLFRPELLRKPWSEKTATTIRLLSDDNYQPNVQLNKSCGKQTDSSPLLRLSQPADVSTDGPSVPMFEPLNLKSTVQTPAFDLISPADSVDTRFTFASEDGESTAGSASVTYDREAEIQRMAAYIREVIEKRESKPDYMSAKLKVHEVILVILLNQFYGDKSKDLQRILTFCDEQGREVSSESRHFKTLDTETMGLLWQKIKRNTKGNYDTFARAMRVRRERTEGFFEYLNAGKGKKKRIYRFGQRSMEEMARFKRTLKQVSRPQGCSC